MNRKLVVICKNCHHRIGITFTRSQIPEIFCTECEAAEFSRQEAKEQYERDYHAALART